jgi:DnaK suppressor protein
MKKKTASAKKRTSAAPRASKTAAAKAPKLKLGPIKKQLLDMRDDLMKTVRNQRITDTGTDTGDSVDQASASIERELLFELSDNERVTLDQIEAALRKIDKGTYGLCESCQKPIAKARLDALPFARYCITCQSTSESAPDMGAEQPDFRGIGGDTPTAE